MSKDYASRAKGGSKTTTVVVIAIVAVAVAAAVGLQVRDRGRARSADQASAAQFRLDGAPCEILSQAAFAAAKGARSGTAFYAEDNQLLMGYGMGECHAFRSGEKDVIGADLVCKFNSPTWLSVTTPKATTRFGTGGGAATVAIRDGEARCVLTR